MSDFLPLRRECKDEDSRDKLKSVVQKTHERLELFRDGIPTELVGQIVCRGGRWPNRAPYSSENKYSTDEIIVQHETNPGDDKLISLPNDRVGTEKTKSREELSAPWQARPGILHRILRFRHTVTKIFCPEIMERCYLFCCHSQQRRFILPEQNAIEDQACYT